MKLFDFVDEDVNLIDEAECVEDIPPHVKALLDGEIVLWIDGYPRPIFDISSAEMTKWANDTCPGLTFKEPKTIYDKRALFEYVRTTLCSLKLSMQS